MRLRLARKGRTQYVEGREGGWKCFEMAVISSAEVARSHYPV